MENVLHNTNDHIKFYCSIHHKKKNVVIVHKKRKIINKEAPMPRLQSCMFLKEESWE